MEVYIDDGDAGRNIRLLEDLEAHKEDIELEIGESLAWQRLENRRACRIALDRPGSIDDDDDALTETREWMVDNLLTFKRVFGPRLAKLLR